MKWLIPVAGAIVLTVLLVLNGCSGNSDQPSTNTQQTQTQNLEQVSDVTTIPESSCVVCHTDKQELIQTSAVVEEVKSEETTGEG